MSKHVCTHIVFFLTLWLCSLKAGASLHYDQTDNDTIPKKTIFEKIREYSDSMFHRHYRDSVLSKLTKKNAPEPKEDSTMVKSERRFLPTSGKTIGNIFFKRIAVFGPRDITDTTFSTRNKLIKIANSLHYDSRQWVIRQTLFFKETDTINAYTLADNERYIRTLPFIQDARIYVINDNEVTGSADVLIVTKDVFEYGIDLSNFSPPNTIAASIYNNDLFGAAQSLRAGFRWDKNTSPTFNGELRYTKNNLAGSFTDFSVGYSSLNNSNPVDTGVYEKSYFININRPLYRPSARFVGGLTLAANHSMNIRSYPDSLFRDYSYRLLDFWVGYNFRNSFRKDGSLNNKPNLAVLLRRYSAYFIDKPKQPELALDPTYNTRTYYLGQFVVFKQQYFKGKYYNGFGRTEDIPQGYTITSSFGGEKWISRNRWYSDVSIQSWQRTKHDGLLNTGIGIGSFWQQWVSEDAVIHAFANYYSKLFYLKKQRIRETAFFDYITCPNNYFYKPLNINYEQGIWGFKRTQVNGYQRLNLRSETVCYSPLKIYGFKFNFFVSLQASLLTPNNESIFKSPLYSGVGIGTRIRNENLTLNTLKLSAYYYPTRPPGMGAYYFEATTVSDLRFDIFPLKMPTFLQFR